MVLSTALDKARATQIQVIASDLCTSILLIFHVQVSQENANLRKTISNLEGQLKDLRLKAKLKITQLQRELDTGKPPGSQTSRSPPTFEADEKVLELQQKVDMLSQELADAKTRSSESLDVHESAQSLDPLSVDHTKVEALTASLAAERLARESAESNLLALQQKLTALESKNAVTAVPDVALPSEAAIGIVGSPVEASDTVRKSTETVNSCETKQCDKKLEDASVKISRLEIDNSSLSKLVKTVKDELNGVKNECQQLKSQVNEHDLKIGEKETALKESEEKIKKLKGLLSQASRSMQESKRIIMDKEASLDSLKASFEDISSKSTNFDTTIDELRRENDELRSQLEDVRSSFVDQLAALERKIEELGAENARVKSEFQSYKVKAHAALHQSNFAAIEARMDELEDSKSKLEHENSELKSQLNLFQDKVRSLENELVSTIENINSLDAQRKTSDDSSREASRLRQELEGALRRLELEKEVHSEAIRSKEISYQSALDTCRRDFKRNIDKLQSQLDQKAAELASLNSICENLSTELSESKEEIVRANNEAERAKSAAAAASAAAANGILNSTNMASGANSGGGGFFSRSGMSSQSSLNLDTAGGVGGYREERKNSMSGMGLKPQVSLSELLTRSGKSFDMGTPTSSGPTLLISNIKEQELSMRLEQISELLMEAEKEVSQLSRQEKVLKEEIRRYERIEKLKDLNVEYLKNIVLSFLETELKEPLVPVLAKILELSPDEVERLKKAYAGIGPITPKAAKTFGFF
ncbi:hypothetical protein HDU97_007751 [Phlyctochytrium planicorne]|nr:hypothetical protein HDU97_007751 [Phlyctochytrium planicorne]